MGTVEQRELDNSIAQVLESESSRKLIVAGPGAGKTTLFRKLLERSRGARDQRLVLTFINNLKDDLDRSLGDQSKVYTLHAYCQYLLHQEPELRGRLTSDFICYPQLASLIKKDWEWLRGVPPPKFVDLMRTLTCTPEQEEFYLGRLGFYDAVDFDGSVYQAYRQLAKSPHLIPGYELVLVDEFQDFNAMEAGIIELLADHSPIVIAGDDDQALYSQLRGASWDHIRSHYLGKEYEVFHLPFCMRCPEVVVGAVADVIKRAMAVGNLRGRIEKPYRFFEPIRGADSRRYPTIDLVFTSTQRRKANYFGRYIEKVIRAISEEDVAQAAEKHEPAVLVIGARPYLPQVEQYLIGVGIISANAAQETVEREEGLLLLDRDAASNLGWRIVLGCTNDAQARRLIKLADERHCPLVDVVPKEMNRMVLQESSELAAKRAEQGEADEPESESVPRVKVTSYEGAKGLSAQHVVLVGLHDGDLPRNPAEIKDLEICKFLVGLTRTKKKCVLLSTRRFGEKALTVSTFVQWIRAARLSRIEVNAAYWK